MRHERAPEGGLKLEMDARETVLLRYLAKGAGFVGMPPGERDAVYGPAKIPAAPGERSET